MDTSMKSKISLISILILFLLLSCKGSSDGKQHYTYTDGEYLAEISYYNPKTRTQSEYTLNIEIEDDKLVKIYWSNGGWLDDSHFIPSDISTGKAEFRSDRNYRYEISLI